MMTQKAAMAGLARPTLSISLLALSFILVASQSFPASALSAKAAALIAPVHNAFVEARRHQALLGAPRSVSDKLIRIAELDQAGRNVMESTDLTPLSADQRDAASLSAWAEIDAQDKADLEALKALMPPTGWFSIPEYGAAASHAAWIVAQHQTASPAFMADVLSRMKVLAYRKEVDADDYSLLVDRVDMLQHRPQEYGSQFVCRNHSWVLYTLLDPAHVDDRRKAIGMTKPESNGVAEISAMPPCYFKIAK